MESMKAPKPMRWMVVVSAVFLAASLIVSGVNAYVAFASPNQSQSPNVPLLVGFEGQLSDSQGSPVSGSKTLTFKLYDEATGTNPALWTEQQTVTVANGLYTVQLGSVTSLQASYFQGQRWLGIQVQGDSSELSPRIPVSSVPFALNAKLSENSISSEGLLGVPLSTATPMAGQSLIYGQSSWQPGNGGAGSLSLTNSTTETTIISRVIPANALSTNGHIHSQIWFQFNNTTGASRNFTFNVKLGSKTSSYTASIGNMASTKRILGRLDIDIANMGAANSQIIMMDWEQATEASAMDTSSINWSDQPLWDTATVDTTAAQTFSVTFSMGTASSSYTTNVLSSTFLGPISN
jgi:hypothetical protein